MQRLVRTHGPVAGVCGGLGDYFSVDPAVFRILFLLGLISGPGFLAYLIMWIVMPRGLTR